MDLSLDEIIERKRGYGGRAADKKFNPSYTKQPRKLLNRTTFKPGQSDKPAVRSFDARNKIIQKTRAKIGDARDILNRNIRDSGIDARQLLQDRKKNRSPLSGEIIDVEALSDRMPRLGRNDSRSRRLQFVRRTAMERSAATWDEEDDEAVGLGGHNRPFTSRLNHSAKPFAPHGYVDHDNMQDLEDEEISRTLHFGNYTNQPPPPRYTFGGFDMDHDDDVEMSTAPLKNNIANDPFAIYEVARNRIERPSLPAPLIVGRTDTGEKLFERRQRNMLTTTNLSDSMRARLFGAEPDRRVSHGIYANENNKQAGYGGGGGGGGGVGVGGTGGTSLMSSQTISMRRPSPPPPLGVANSKAGYRLLVSNLHAKVTTADIRELFSDIGPMYDARVVRPGTAEVIYKTLEHAEMAVEAYHHREFDDQPMHCVLVNPHSSHRTARLASSRTVTTNSSGVEVDIDALHSVLFRDR
ncbi:uncharacterized protein [Drosophila kikkawai]|uniref:RRM domain-containing protein n=1 Tax=Drosophila kikkawai TaxID=30033 RepID=A0A6P4JGT0_DROKI|nr:uncharacterized protein LOC108082938 [Drosophila kikkawai]